MLQVVAIVHRQQVAFHRFKGTSQPYPSQRQQLYRDAIRDYPIPLLRSRLLYNRP